MKQRKEVFLSREIKKYCLIPLSSKKIKVEQIILNQVKRCWNTNCFNRSWCSRKISVIDQDNDQLVVLTAFCTIIFYHLPAPRYISTAPPPFCTPIRNHIQHFLECFLFIPSDWDKTKPWCFPFLIYCINIKVWFILEILLKAQINQFKLSSFLLETEHIDQYILIFTWINSKYGPLLIWFYWPKGY